MKVSTNSFVATVVFKKGGERDIHCDQIHSIAHGFNFCREDGSFDFLNGDTVDSMEVVRASATVGPPQ